MERSKDEEADALMDSKGEGFIHILSWKGETWWGGGGGGGGRRGRSSALPGGALHAQTGDGRGGGLTCDGGCGRALRRGTGWWCCDECDFDVCDACGGGEEGEEGEE